MCFNLALVFPAIISLTWGWVIPTKLAISLWLNFSAACRIRTAITSPSWYLWRLHSSLSWLFNPLVRA